MSKIVQIAELSVYGEEDEVLLENLSFNLERGDIAQLTGLSEAQYETLFSVLTGEITPNSGQVVLGDRNIVRLSQKKRKNMLGNEVSFLPREFVLPEDKTVLQSLKFKLKLTKAPLELEELLAEILDLTELESVRNVYPAEMDELERVKTAIAISIVTEPDLLICHEPFLSLNSNQLDNALRIISAINESKDTSVLLLTDGLNGDSAGVKVIESNLDSRVVS